MNKRLVQPKGELHSDSPLQFLDFQCWLAYSTREISTTWGTNLSRIGNLQWFFKICQLKLKHNVKKMVGNGSPKWQQRSPKFRPSEAFSAFQPSGFSDSICGVGVGSSKMFSKGQCWSGDIIHFKSETCDENVDGWYGIGCLAFNLDGFFQKPSCSRTDESVQVRLGHPHPLLSLFPPEHGQHPSSIATVTKTSKRSLQSLGSPAGFGGAASTSFPASNA